MSTARHARLQSLIKQEFAKEIAKSFTNEKFGMVTVTAVELNDKLSHAKVFVHPTKGGSQVIAALDKQKKLFLKNIYPHLELRYFPSIAFYYDHSPEHVDRISTLLRNLDIPKDDLPED